MDILMVILMIHHGFTIKMIDSPFHGLHGYFNGSMDLLKGRSMGNDLLFTTNFHQLAPGYFRLQPSTSASQRSYPPIPVHHHMGVFKNGACCIAFFLKDLERSFMDYHKNHSIVILNYHCTTMEKRSILLPELEI